MTTILTIYAVIALVVFLWLLEAAVRLRDGWRLYAVAVLFAVWWPATAMYVAVYAVLGLARGRLR